MMETCTHLDQIQPVTPSANGCEECLKTGQTWVHLRICEICGHVGCCDSSVGKHATKHFHATTHPIIRSIEPGEHWGWCYVDQVQFERLARAGQGVDDASLLETMVGTAAMRILVAVFAAVLITGILWEGFETIILPRTVTRGLRFARFFYIYTWRFWVKTSRLVPSSEARDTYLGYFGPLSLILLLVVWTAGLVTGFAMLQWGIGSHFQDPMGRNDFLTDLYQSGVTFFTLGYGDVVPFSEPARFVCVLETGTGFGFLALVIGYLPVLYQGFSRREGAISLLDARAGSPPTAAELLRRYAQAGSLNELQELLAQWERWSSDTLESHLSYPVLAFYRSQHDGQSWLAALTALMDTCALIMVGVKDAPAWQARLTYAMARHTVVDLALTFRVTPTPPAKSQLPPATMALLRETLETVDLAVCITVAEEQELSELRRAYEPYVYALSERFLLPLPPWVQEEPTPDDWQSSAWETAESHFR